jgi:hypothetical protein
MRGKMSIQITGTEKKTVNFEISEKELLRAVESYIKQKYIPYVDNIDDGKLMIEDWTDYHTGKNYYKVVGDASDIQILAYQTIVDLRKLFDKNV